MSTPKEQFKHAFQETEATLAKDMPLLLHGSGDVDPSQVNPATARLLAALTAEYIQKLVDAAIDSHQMLRDSLLGSVTTAPPALPPPVFIRKRQPSIPTPPTPTPFIATDSHSNSSTAATTSTLLDSHNLADKRKRHCEEFWDEPLPVPKIKRPNEDKTTASADLAPDQWVGVAGVDFLEQRARTAYVQGPTYLTTQSFIFPLCHDVFTYGRILEVQTARRTLASLLVDPVVTDLVRVEGKKQQQQHQKQKKKTGSSQYPMGGTSGTTSDPEDDDNGEEYESADEDGPLHESSWPGLDDLLPFYRVEGIMQQISGDAS